MAYPIEYIEGIGEGYGARLRRAGIRTTRRLLEVCADPHGRSSLAEKTGIEETRLLKWAGMADLMRIRGIGRTYAELLAVAGVPSVRELRASKPADLTRCLSELNGRRRLCRALPSEAVVRRWIDEAKALTPVVTH